MEFFFIFCYLLTTRLLSYAHLEDNYNQSFKMNESLLLLQKTDRWTSRHLEIARVRVVPDVSAVQLFGDFCPEDGDPGKEYT